MHIEFSRDQATSFPDVADPDAVETARVWHCKYRTLEPLSRFKNLRGLEVATFPDLSLEPIGSLGQLRYLSVLHLPKVTELSHLQGLLALETLGLQTLPSWDSSGKRTVVQSLDPLTQLEQLRHIELLGVIPSDQSLMALERLPNLQTANFHGFLKPEVERFFAASGVTKAHIPPADF